MFQWTTRKADEPPATSPSEATPRPAPGTTPTPVSSGSHHGYVSGPISQGFSGKVAAQVRGTIASFKGVESKDLEVFIKEDRDVIEAYVNLMRQRKGGSDFFGHWATGKEEDIRAIGVKLCQIQEIFIKAENEFIESLEESRARMKVIRNREKAIGEARGRLKAAVGRRDQVQKQNKPADDLIQECRKLQQHVYELEAAHLGATRLDLRESLRLKHEAYAHYAVKMSVAAKFSIHLADQIPQGTVLPGQNLPPFIHQTTLEEIMTDFKTAFESDELVTVLRIENQVPAFVPPPVADIQHPPSPAGSGIIRETPEPTSSAAPKSPTLNYPTSNSIVEAPAVNPYHGLTTQVSNLTLGSSGNTTPPLSITQPQRSPDRQSPSQQASSLFPPGSGNTYNPGYYAQYAGYSAQAPAPYGALASQPSPYQYPPVSLSTQYPVPSTSHPTYGGQNGYGTPPVQQQSAPYGVNGYAQYSQQYPGPPSGSPPKYNRI